VNNSHTQKFYLLLQAKAKQKMTHEIIEQYLRNRTKQDGDHILWTGNVDEYSRPKCLRISELKE
jgi:hypothetical protein